ncbi:hypothetical protein CapIbe_020234 [Capra ibex]
MIELLKLMVYFEETASHADTEIYFQNGASPGKPQRAGCVRVCRVNLRASEGTRTVSFAQVTQKPAEILYQRDAVWSVKQNACAAKPNKI